jgi:hypothetical protein
MATCFEELLTLEETRELLVNNPVEKVMEKFEYLNNELLAIVILEFDRFDVYDAYIARDKAENNGEIGELDRDLQGASMNNHINYKKLLDRNLIDETTTIELFNEMTSDLNLSDLTLEDKGNNVLEEMNKIIQLLEQKTGKIYGIDIDEDGNEYINVIEK